MLRIWDGMVHNFLHSFGRGYRHRCCSDDVRCSVYYPRSCENGSCLRRIFQRKPNTQNRLICGFNGVNRSGLSIKNNDDISAKITPVFPGNDNIAANIIAPTAEGYFDLVFDFSDVDVSFKYDINVTADDTSAVSDLVTTGYSIDGGTRVNFADFNTPISDTIHLADNINSRTIRVYVMWNDDPDTATMNNIDDTASTLKSDSSAVLKVSVALTQVAQ